MQGRTIYFSIFKMLVLAMQFSKVEGRAIRVGQIAYTSEARTVPLLRLFIGSVLQQLLPYVKDIHEGCTFTTEQ